MALEHEVDDDYVARLLIEDAKRTSKKYSQQSLSSLISVGRSSTAPKPNTRFLSHIVREADQHNTALKRKEEAESELRLLALEQHDHPRKKRRTDEDVKHSRNRLLKDIADAANSTRRSGQKQPARLKEPENKDTRNRFGKRNEVISGREECRSNERKRRRERSESFIKMPERSGSGEISQQEQRDVPTKSRHPDQRRRRTDRSPSSESSDPLKDVTRLVSRHSRDSQIRGRGSKRQISDIDGHFAPNYDPAEDVSMDSGGDGADWDMALEALRDRAKWKRNQTARLRDAGFDEDQISGWSNGALDKTNRSTEKDTDFIKWARKGEVREWDAGKPLH